MPSASFAVRYLRKGPCVSFDGLRDGLAINKLPLAAAGDQPGFAENLEMVGHGCGSDPAHGNDFSAIHMFGAGDGLKNPEAGLVGQSFRYFLNLRAVHRSIQSVAKSLPLPPGRTLSLAPNFRKPVTDYFDVHLSIEIPKAPESGEMNGPGEGQADNSAKKRDRKSTRLNS